MPQIASTFHYKSEEVRALVKADLDKRGHQTHVTTIGLTASGEAFGVISTQEKQPCGEVDLSQGNTDTPSVCGKYQVVIEESDRQMICLQLANGAVRSPGWKHYLTEISAKLPDGKIMFDKFYEIEISKSTDDPRSKELESKLRAVRDIAVEARDNGEPTDWLTALNRILEIVGC